MLDHHEESQHRVEMHGLIIRLQVDGKEFVFIDQTFFQLIAYGLTTLWGAGLFALVIVGYMGLDALLTKFWG